ncbi:MAG: YebC/PmpR family DNA-binding transcriptional regulator [Candidatus Altimarinota bacterium]
MGRGPVIAAKKSQSNAAKQKVFTIHAKLIAIAAAKGGDPDTNPSLYDAIEKAKKDNVPNENIARAIKKGTGEDKTGVQIDQIVYEGYGAGGVAVIVTTLTDNKNRTAPNMRHIFSKYGGNLGESGSVSFVFEKKGILAISLENYNRDELEELVFETSCEDFFEEEGMFKITTSLENFSEVRKFFEAKNISLDFSDIDYIPSNTVEVDDFDKALKLTKMLEAFHEDEDVEKISVNMNISPELQKEVDEFIEKNTFRT